MLNVYTKSGRSCIALLMLLGFALLCGGGCQPYAQGRSAEELLSLSISGLAGVDQYSFTGKTVIRNAAGVQTPPVIFQGKVEDHHNIKVQSSEKTYIDHFASQPLALLKKIQAGKAKVEVVGAKSGQSTAVLRIEMDPSKARRIWQDQLTASMNEVEKKLDPAKAERSLQPLQQSSKEAYLKEWKAELDHSKKQLEKMLGSLQVESVYELTIDRKRLLPLKLDEQTLLHYEVDGNKLKEGRKAEMTFAPSG
ncbi:hypothetical protein [Paenibacillus sp. GCM10027626]|uniref:hypothetical protein n=1 Tax=Paenibacillus sp. GCM10027626 TaxID=3273411 RepID=UPI003640A005